MNKQQRIQAAIDALPNATGGEWKPRKTHTELDLWCIDWSEAQEEVAENVYGEANATLIAAAKDLAEEVLRLREVVVAHEGGKPDELRKVYGYAIGVDMPGPGCRDHGVRTTAHKEGDVLVVDSVEVIPNTSGPDVSCDVCGAVGFPHGANCPRCGRPSSLLHAASEGEA